ncbi:rod shape-determining protein MreD [Mangrovibacterium marinum]|uniref:Rod shape-determining protein MreD n=1 Tax=Mangrovibacterium marinum TaxID=1639118 RepID=A0A2T5BXU6_9BACT|nr:rod shape-determining protein MreD [Mangrovibacterium marinum]PTN05963.1 rod shape-determining protein MreD [Mangrovibacterium marinum]
MNSGIFKYIGSWLILVLLQVLLLNHIQISGYVNPYLYILFILTLPFNTPNYLLLLLGFLLGLNIDIFTNTLGMHAAATTFVAFIRPSVINLISSRDVLELNQLPRISELGFSWFFRYSLIMVLSHHLFLFYIEVFTFSGFFHTLLRSLLSSALTIVLILVSQYMTAKQN